MLFTASSPPRSIRDSTTYACQSNIYHHQKSFCSGYDSSIEDTAEGKSALAACPVVLKARFHWKRDHRAICLPGGHATCDQLLGACALVVHCPSVGELHCCQASALHPGSSPPLPLSQRLRPSLALPRPTWHLQQHLPGSDVGHLDCLPDAICMQRRLTSTGPVERLSKPQ